MKINVVRRQQLGPKGFMKLKGLLRDYEERIAYDFRYIKGKRRTFSQEIPCFMGYQGLQYGAPPHRNHYNRLEKNF